MNENLAYRCMSLRDESLQQPTPSGANIDKVIKALDGIYSRLGNSMTIKELDTITVSKELLKEQRKTLRKKQDDIDRLCVEISQLKHKLHDKPNW